MEITIKKVEQQRWEKKLKCTTINAVGKINWDDAFDTKFSGS